MNKGFKSSSESKKCVVCGKQTANFRTYEQSSIEVSIPLCDDVYHNRYCYKGVDVQVILKRQLIDLKREVIRTSQVKILPEKITG